MRRFCLFLLSAALLLSFFTVSAAESEYHFYIKRGKDHAPPETDGRFLSLFRDSCFYRDMGAEARKEKKLYLTFDAGYENGNVSKILDVMKEEGVTGAFFVLSHLVKSEPQLLTRMKAEGHLICNHTARHKNMACFDDEAFVAELSALETLYTQTTGEELSRFYRPPEGTFSEQNLRCAEKMGYKTVFWSLAYADWCDDVAPSAEKAIELLKENTHDGAIVLLHPTTARNVQVLTEMIRYWKAAGYTFHSLNELAQ